MTHDDTPLPAADTQPAMAGQVDRHVGPDALTLADQLEDDCLITGIGRREHLDYRIDAATALRTLHAEVSAWRERFKQSADRRRVFDAGFQRGWDAAVAATQSARPARRWATGWPNAGNQADPEAQT